MHQHTQIQNGFGNDYNPLSVTHSLGKFSVKRQRGTEGLKYTGREDIIGHTHKTLKAKDKDKKGIMNLQNKSGNTRNANKGECCDRETGINEVRH